MANILTTVRIICAPLILIFPAFSTQFYVFYLLGGITDAIDGTVARKLGKATAWGAKYDSAADILFALAALIRIIGSVDFPLWLLLWIGTIAFIKAANMIAGFLRYHRFTAVHSVRNKVCGVAVFLSPLFIGAECAWQAKAPAAMAVCVIASIAAVQESVCIAKGGRAE